MSEALAAVFPATTLQTCIVHLLRQQPGLCELERAQTDGGGPAPDLHRGERGRRARPRSTSFAQRPVGPPVPDGRRRRGAAPGPT